MEHKKLHLTSQHKPGLQNDVLVLITVVIMITTGIEKEGHIQLPLLCLPLLQKPQHISPHTYIGRGSTSSLLGTHTSTQFPPLLEPTPSTPTSPQPPQEAKNAPSPPSQTTLNNLQTPAVPAYQNTILPPQH